MAAHGYGFREAIEERVSRGQPRESVVRLPSDVHSPSLFDVDCGDVLDLTGTRYLSSDATPGLIRLAKRGSVRLRAIRGFQPLEKLQRLFGNALRPDLAHEHGWVIDLCLSE